MSQHPNIRRYEISPAAKAGIAIRNLQTEGGEEDHDHSTPHRDNHYLLMVATHGRFNIQLDFKEVIIDQPSLLVISPGQVHHVLDIGAPISLCEQSSGFSLNINISTKHGWKKLLP